MSYKFLELEEVKENGRWTESGVSAPKAYKGHKRCAHCENEFIVNQLKPGREPIYCSNRCKVAAYVKRKGKREQHPLAEMQGLKGGTDERYLAQIKDELKEQVKAQVEELKEEQKTVNNTILNEIAALKKEITNNKKETSLQVQKASKRTSQDVFIDAGIGVGTTFIGNRLDNFLRSEENKQTQKKDLIFLLKEIERMHVQLCKSLDIKIEQVPEKIQKQQGVFY